MEWNRTTALGRVKSRTTTCVERGLRAAGSHFFPMGIVKIKYRGWSTHTSEDVVSNHQWETSTGDSRSILDALVDDVLEHAWVTEENFLCLSAMVDERALGGCALYECPRTGAQRGWVGWFGIIHFWCTSSCESVVVLPHGQESGRLETAIRKRFS